VVDDIEWNVGVGSLEGLVGIVGGHDHDDPGACGRGSAIRRAGRW
jgi:hypothetical protein